MKKKEIKIEEVKIDERTNPDSMFSFADKDEILRLAHVVTALQKDMDSIYNLFKKYILPNAPMYKTNCNCSVSISSYYQKLLDFYSENMQKFI